MRIEVFEDPIALGKAAAAVAAETIEEAVEARGRARIIAATGVSQLAFVDALTRRPGLPWSCVELFHLDEYIGLPITHPASFRKYLLERLISKTGLTTYHLLEGEADPELVCQEVGRALTTAPIDVAFVGIGENGHLAFNDPPADFETEQPYLIVTLDEACRRQQVGEGWFAALDDVPQRAISMSIRQILKSRRILCIAPDLRKAEAVRACFSGRVSPMAPASILRTHPDTTLFLDFLSASLLDPATIARGEL
ncbi:MAG: glucosamine-6-phosphate deaminase [Luteitalea sp.]|nr:glucosamine-6-phosphate deaminase [Luteitalea sp.]